MISDQDIIETMFDAVPSLDGLIALLSPQERTRLADLIYSELLIFEQTNTIIPSLESWVNSVEPKILRDLKENSNFFGVKDMSQVFDSEAFLKQFYHFEYEIGKNIKNK